MRKSTALITVLVLSFAVTVTAAQEAQQEPMYVSITYVSVKPDMTQAFMAAMADHTEWHRSINDNHYYEVSQVLSGPRTGQIAISAGPMTGAELDEAGGFADQDMGDVAQRGMFSYVDSVETIYLETMPEFGNPPPPGTHTAMVHVYELELAHAQINSFMQALATMEEAQDAVGPGDDYTAWVMPLSGTGFNTRWLVVWVDGWADSGQDREREARVMEAAGGQEAYEAIIEDLMGAVRSSQITTYMNLPQLSHRPEGQ